MPRKCDKFPPKDTTASELCPSLACLCPDLPSGNYLKESAGMTPQTSQSKDNPGPDNESLCLAACTSPLERVSSPHPGLPFPSFPPSFCLRPELSSPSHSEGTVSFSDPKSAPQRQGTPALSEAPAASAASDLLQGSCLHRPPPYPRSVSGPLPFRKSLLLCFVSSSLCFFPLIPYMCSQRFRSPRNLFLASRGTRVHITTCISEIQGCSRVGIDGSAYTHVRVCVCV